MDVFRELTESAGELHRDPAAGVEALLLQRLSCKVLVRTLPERLGVLISPLR
jgi:hypothetical protein